MRTMLRPRRVPALLVAAALGLSVPTLLPSTSVAAPPAVAHAAAPAGHGEHAAVQKVTVQKASMDWAVKDSFLRYVRGPIARGSIDVDGVAATDAGFRFTGGTGTLTDGSGEISFPGTVRFSGHEKKLEITITELRLRITGKRGTLVADVNSRAFVDTRTQGEMRTYDDVELATVDLTNLNITKSALALQDAPATLTKNGSPAFGGFYDPGTALSPLTVKAEISASPAEKRAKPSTRHAVKAASRKDGLIVEVSGRDYANLPAASTGRPAAGVYAAIVDASIPTERITADNVAGVQYVPRISADGTFTTDVKAPASALSPTAEYTVVVWVAHGTVTAQTLLHKAPLTLDAGQRKALFPAPPTTKDDPAPGKERPVTPAEPGGRETGDGGTKDASGARAVSAARLEWGLKESFRRYIEGPIARGSFTVKGLAKSPRGFTWTSGNGTYDPSARTGQISFPGSLHATGHDGKLDITITDVRLQIDGGTGRLIADVRSRDFVNATTTGPMRTYDDVVVATVDLSTARLGGDALRIDGASTALTAQGAKAFGGFYRPGEELDPLSVTATLNGSGSERTPAPVDPEESTSTPDGHTSAGEHSDTSPAGSTTGAGRQGERGTAPRHATSAPRTTPLRTTPQRSADKPVCVPVQVSREVPVASTADSQTTSGSRTGAVSQARLDWGVRTSFRNYISGGIAKGSWELSGVRYGNGVFGFSGGTGTFSSGSGSVTVPGSIRFTGHDGILDLRLKNLRLEIAGSKGVLHAHVVSNDMSGRTTDYGTIPVADVDLTGLRAEGGTLSVKNAPATLTAKGAAGFAGFYKAGEPLDPVTLTATLSQRADRTDAGQTRTVTVTEYRGEGCTPQQLNANGAALARTGAPIETSTAIGLSATLLGAGMAATAWSRRRARKG